MVRSFYVAIALLTLLLTGCAALLSKPQSPQVTLANIQLVDMGLLEQRYRMDLRMLNPNNFALPISGMSYDLAINGKVFARGVSRQEVNLPAFGEDILQIDVVSDLSKLISQLNDLGGDNRIVRYSVAGSVAVMNRSLRLPFKHEGEVAFDQMLKPSK